jgi:hypothetical protein
MPIIIVVIVIARLRTSREQLLELATVEPDAAATFATVDRDAVSVELLERSGRTTWTLHWNLLGDQRGAFARGAKS